jgi:hypothetical protein
MHTFTDAGFVPVVVVLVLAKHTVIGANVSAQIRIVRACAVYHNA